MFKTTKKPIDDKSTTVVMSFKPIGDGLIIPP